MAYDPGAIDATLAAAVGDEPELIAELRGAFLDSANRALDQLEAARRASDWRLAASRLQLSASIVPTQPTDASAPSAGSSQPKRSAGVVSGSSSR